MPLSHQLYPQQLASGGPTRRMHAGTVTRSSSVGGGSGSGPSSSGSASRAEDEEESADEVPTAVHRRALRAASEAARHAGAPRGLVGLSNLGNTCFMNSCLQCVSNIPPLTDLVLSPALHVNRLAATSRSRGEVVRAWAALMTRIWGAASGEAGARARSYESPAELKRVVASIAPRFASYEQQDSQEFLVFLLDALSDDTNENAARAAYRELAERPEDADAHVAGEWWAYMRSHCNSRVRDLVTGQHKTAVRCSACGHTSRAFDTFTTLSLPIPRAGGAAAACTLGDCLSAFTAPEELTGVDAHYCSRCKAHQPSVKTMTLFRLPAVLVIQLKRFCAAGYRRTKLETNVRFPTDALDLRPYLPEGGEFSAAAAAAQAHPQLPLPRAALTFAPRLAPLTAPQPR